MWIARYRAVPPKVDRRRPIEGEKGKKKKRKRKKRREEENLAPVLARAPMSPLPCTGVALAHGLPARRRPRIARARRRPHPCEVTERLPVGGERSRRCLQYHTIPLDMLGAYRSDMDRYVRYNSVP
ncbi:hypothetical protein BHM03_00037832 [Ensete ventricosum]|nr:hypothetical protein BHM03_00037832 [Ensete ventricosum]